MTCGRHDESCKTHATHVCTNTHGTIANGKNIGAHDSTMMASDGKHYRCDLHKRPCCQIRCDHHTKPTTPYVYCANAAITVCTKIGGNGHDSTMVHPDGKAYRCKNHAGTTGCCVTISASGISTAIKNFCPDHPGVQHKCRWCHDTKLYYPLVGPATPCKECK